jgi:hypothetical protein
MMSKFDECVEGYERLLNDIEDLESDTFREHWFYRARAYRVKTGCFVHFNQLMEAASRYPSLTTLDKNLGIHAMNMDTCIGNIILSKEKTRV